jgi:hypothetical protein
MCGVAKALQLLKALPGSSDLRQAAAVLRKKRQTGLPSMLLFLGSWVAGCWAVAAAVCDESQPTDSNKSVRQNTETWRGKCKVQLLLLWTSHGWGSNVIEA